VQGEGGVGGSGRGGNRGGGEGGGGGWEERKCGVGGEER